MAISLRSMFCENLSKAALARPQVLSHLLTNACREGMTISRSCEGNTGGWYPREHWKGDRPEEALGRELWAYSTQGRRLHQAEGFPEVMQRRNVSKD